MQIKKKVMAEKTYKLSLDQLSDIVSDAVSNALKKLDNIEIIDEQVRQPSVKVGEMSDEQFREALSTMEPNRGAGDEPKVGIFWWNATLRQLFGVVTHTRT